jgi:hypothetical protein
VVLARVKRYGSPELLDAALAAYAREEDPLTRLRIVGVLDASPDASLATLSPERYAVLRAEADPRVAVWGTYLTRRLPPSVSVPWLADQIARPAAPAWLRRVAYGGAVDRGLGDAVKEELRQRGAEEALRFVAELEETHRGPCGVP